MHMRARERLQSFETNRALTQAPAAKRTGAFFHAAVKTGTTTIAAGNDRTRLRVSSQKDVLPMSAEDRSTTRIVGFSLFGIQMVCMLLAMWAS